MIFGMTQLNLAERRNRNFGLTTTERHHWASTTSRRIHMAARVISGILRQWMPLDDSGNGGLNRILKPLDFHIAMADAGDGTIDEILWSRVVLPSVLET